ncbi:MAG: geranylgeranyl reductase family protein [bacterium]
MPGERHYDVIIVGAGPAGACTAIYIDAERTGKRVLLLEAKKQVGIPMQCGEAIPTYQELLTIFPQADCAELYDLPDHVYAGTIAGIKFKSPTGTTYVAPLKGQMFYRDRLDRHFFQRAVARGADYRLGCRVRHIAGNSIVTDHETFTADIIVGADGVFSTVAASFPVFKPNRDICPCSLVLARGDFYADLVELWFESRFPGGYFWLFPKNRVGEANIGLGMRGAKNVRGMLNQVLEEIRETYNLQIIQKSGGAVPLGGLKRNLVYNHVALVGDAAGMVFPTNGGGTGLAMMAGKWLGEIIAQNKPLLEYERKVNTIMRPVLASSLRTRRQMDFFRRNERMFSAMMWLADLRGWRHFIIG